MYKFIVMLSGYAENMRTSPLIYQCGFFGKDGYSTRKEAVTKLALDFHVKYQDEFTDKFTSDDFMLYISRLHDTTCDSYGEAERTSERSLAWWPFWINDFIKHNKKEEVIFIPENAEVIITMALFEAMPELNDNKFVDTKWWQRLCDESKDQYDET